jgi:hypothetical protein
LRYRLPRRISNLEKKYSSKSERLFGVLTVSLLFSRKLCIFAAHHQFQVDCPIDSAFDGHLRELIRHHQVDCILEEPTGLPAKSWIELLADELGIRWADIDLTAEQRKLVPVSALTGKYDTLQGLSLHSHRESAWVAKVSEMTAKNSGLLIVGLCMCLAWARNCVGLTLKSRRTFTSPSAYTTGPDDQESHSRIPAEIKMNLRET